MAGRALEHLTRAAARLGRQLPEVVTDVWVMPLCPSWGPLLGETIRLAVCVHAVRMCCVHM